MTRRTGLTLIELLVALAMSAIVIVGIASAYAVGVKYEQDSRESQANIEKKVRFEQLLTKMLRGAYVSTAANDTLTYFNGIVSGTSASQGADTLTFTSNGEGFNGSILSTDDDFETLNTNFGPQGGMAEISLSTTPVGDVGQGQSGLFLRQQRPADGDSTQGGYESVLSPDVKTIQFEFYNGTDWDTAWSTTGQSSQSAQSLTAQDGRRIPAAVRVTYTFNNDPDGVQHVLVVRLPQSDVTADNPVVVAGATQ